MEPVLKEDEFMEGSESQILNPSESCRASVAWPMKADFPMRDGYFLEASSRQSTNSFSLASVSGVCGDDGIRGDSKHSEFETFDGVFDCFLAFGGMSKSLQGMIMIISTGLAIKKLIAMFQNGFITSLQFPKCFEEVKHATSLTTCFPVQPDMLEVKKKAAQSTCQLQQISDMQTDDRLSIFTNNWKAVVVNSFELNPQR